MSEESQTPPPSEQYDISEDEKLLAVLAYVPFVCFVPFFKREESSFVHGHVRLGMALFFVEVVALCCCGFDSFGIWFFFSASSWPASVL